MRAALLLLLGCTTESHVHRPSIEEAVDVGAEDGVLNGRFTLTYPPDTIPEKVIGNSLRVSAESDAGVELFLDLPGMPAASVRTAPGSIWLDRVYGRCAREICEVEVPLTITWTRRGPDTIRVSADALLSRGGLRRQSRRFVDETEATLEFSFDR